MRNSPVRTLDNGDGCTYTVGGDRFRRRGSQKAVIPMARSLRRAAKNTRQTSAKVAHQASVILSSSKSTKAQKSVAASALAQAKKKGS